MTVQFKMILLLLLILNVSCGKRKESGSTKRPTRLTEERIQEIMENQFASCAAIGDGACPSGITRLMILNKEDADKSYVCSGFMVGPRTMVTNHHCIPDQATCENTYIVLYEGREYTQNKCKKHLKSNEDYHDPNDRRRAEDYSIVEIEDTYYGTYFPAATEPLAAMENVTSWVVDHTGLDAVQSNPYEFRITELNCNATRDPSFASLLLQGCPVVNGNSGSPVLNKAGSLVGVIWGAYGLEKNPKIYSVQSRRAVISQGLMTELKYFQNYLSAEAL
ncbi:MAG TPA: serine protease [Bacteriovoracaceae bacterium]|nr:serine protease [Bacteriovoracaceae bacterium]